MLKRPAAPRLTDPAVGVAPSGLKALTLRLGAGPFREIELLAAAENRSPTNFVETLVLRELRARSEEGRVVAMRAAPARPGPRPPTRPGARAGSPAP